MASQLCLMCGSTANCQTLCLGARPRYSLVVDEDVKKPNKQTINVHGQLFLSVGPTKDEDKCFKSFNEIRELECWVGLCLVNSPGNKRMSIYRSFGFLSRELL